MEITRVWRPCLAELIGTFALTFIGAGAILANETLGSGGFGLLGVALAHGLVLAIFVSGTIHISGGHINPAVTLGFMITQCIHPGVGLLYMISQLLGAALAAGLLTALFPQEIWGKVALGAPQLGETVSFGIGVLVEAVLTFFLVFTVFATAVDPRGPKSIAGFGIGLVLVFDMIVGGPLTGAAMNPARAFGPTLAVNLSEVWSDHLVYWIGPLLGGGLAALVYHYGLGEEAKPAAAAPTRAARGRRTPPA